jgi:hypothetical protein
MAIRWTTFCAWLVKHCAKTPLLCLEVRSDLIAFVIALGHVTTVVWIGDFPRTSSVIVAQSAGQDVHNMTNVAAEIASPLE